MLEKILCTSISFTVKGFITTTTNNNSIVQSSSILIRHSVNDVVYNHKPECTAAVVQWYSGLYSLFIVTNVFLMRIVQELCESRGGRPGLSVLTSLLVSVDVKIYCTVLRHWSQLVPKMSHDI